MMKKFITKISQKYADFIIIMLDKSLSDKDIEFWYSQGLLLNSWIIENYDVYLN